MLFRSAGATTEEMVAVTVRDDHERRTLREASARMREILLDQRFKSGIPAGLPEAARVAHKSGNISTVHHDAGIVYLEGRPPYVLVVLTQFAREAGVTTAVADVSRDIYECLAGMDGG